MTLSNLMRDYFGNILHETPTTRCKSIF